MRGSVSIFLSSGSPGRTCAIAQRVAAILHPGDVLLMTGDIGAGKTHFARCLIQSLLKVPEDVPSPTYTLVQTYPGRTGEIWHADLYRLGDPNDVFELGLIDAFETAICLVEWPDRLGELAPQGALALEIATGEEEDARRLTFSGDPGIWAARLEGLTDD